MSEEKLLEINQKRIILIVGVAIALTIIIIGISWLTVSKHRGDNKKVNSGNIGEMDIASNGFVAEREDSVITQKSENTLQTENKKIIEQEVGKPLMDNKQEEKKGIAEIQQKKTGTVTHPPEKAATKTLYNTNINEIWVVQVGAYKVKDNASKALNLLKGKGVKAEMKNDAGLFKIISGSYKDKEGAAAQAERIKKAGFDCKILPVKNEKKG